MTLIDTCLATCRSAALVFQFLRNVCSFYDFNSANLSQTSSWGNTASNAQEVYIANRKECIGIVKTISLFEASLQGLKSLPQPLGAHIPSGLQRLKTCTDSCKQMVRRNIMPLQNNQGTSLDWTKKQLWIVKQVYARPHMKEEMAALITELNDIADQLDFARRVSVLSIVAVEDGSAISDIKQFLAAQDVLLQGEICSELLEAIQYLEQMERQISPLAYHQLLQLMTGNKDDEETKTRLKELFRTMRSLSAKLDPRSEKRNGLAADESEASNAAFEPRHCSKANLTIAPVLPDASFHVFQQQSLDSGASIARLDLFALTAAGIDTQHIQSASKGGSSSQYVFCVLQQLTISAVPNLPVTLEEVSNTSIATAPSTSSSVSLNDVQIQTKNEAITFQAQRGLQSMWLSNSCTQYLRLYGLTSVDSKLGLCMVMQYCNSIGSLQSNFLWKEEIDDTGRMYFRKVALECSLGRFQQIKAVSDMLLALNYLHSQPRPVVHGDLKAESILVNAIDHFNEASQLDFYLSIPLDFFLSFTSNIHNLRAASSQQQQQQQQWAGSHRWKAPEVIRAPSMNETPEERKQRINSLPSDVYSFGLMIAEIFLRLPPFAHHSSDQPESITADVLNSVPPYNWEELQNASSAALSSFVQRCCYPDPKLRPTVCQILIRDWPQVVKSLVQKETSDNLDGTHQQADHLMQIHPANSSSSSSSESTLPRVQCGHSHCSLLRSKCCACLDKRPPAGVCSVEIFRSGGQGSKRINLPRYKFYCASCVEYWKAAAPLDNDLIPSNPLVSVYDSKQNSHSCEQCLKKFTSPTLLQKHVQDAHGGDAKSCCVTM